MKKGLIRGVVCSVGQVIVWLMMAISVVSLGMVVSQSFEQAHAQEQRPTRYSVTLYSGGKAVERWWVDRQPSVHMDSNTIRFDGRIIVGGPIVIEPAPKPVRPE